ncbi:P-loop containing nucleoside triphosphate hydrolase protein [Phlebopus sp. FC_14]|nr:P-loop containing nucleoside triphosphate hydrolase protein [Phlebopus sp. FC_14]
MGRAILNAQQPPIKNIIFIGETGVGKSSLINLIAGRDVARVSNDSGPCTTTFSSYDVDVWDHAFRLWDTPGLNEGSFVGSLLSLFSGKTEKELKNFLRKRYEAREIDLVVFCVHGGRNTKAMEKTYKNFCVPTRCVAAPVVLAVTTLERFQPAMDTWWVRNEKRFREMGMEFDGHACVTCISHSRRLASRREICNLIVQEAYRSSWRAEENSKYLPGGRTGCIIA